MQQCSRKWIGLGVLLGMLTGIVVIVVSYVADQVAGLIFPPFSLFDFMARVLPGAAATFTIDLLVDIVTSLNLGSTSETAKLAEQAIAIVQFVVLGGAFGAILGTLPQDRYSSRLPALGLGLGLQLPDEHGFPLRIYTPNRYGMKQPKWIVLMKAVAGEPPGYWV